MKTMTNPDKPSITDLPKRYAFFIGIVAGLIYLVIGIAAIFHSTNSIAAIGLLLLPFEASIIFLIFAFLGFCIGLITQGILDRHYRYKPRFFLACIIIIPAILLIVTLGKELSLTL